MTHRSMSEVDADLHILDQRIRVHVENGMQNVLDIAQDISQCCPEDDGLKTTVRDLMVEFIEMEKEIKLQVTALGQIKQMSKNMADPSQEMPNPIRCLEEKLSQLEAAGGPNPDSHPKYKEMELKMIEENMISDEEFNSLRSTLLGHTEEDDVALTQTEVNTKCPYSRRMMVNPVRNTDCGHVYDREPILEHIKSRRGRAKCPVGGCSNAVPLKPDRLELHVALKKYIDCLNQRNQASSS